MNGSRIVFGFGTAVLAVAAHASIFSVNGGTNQVASRPSNILVNGSFEAQVGSLSLNRFWATGTTLTPSISLTGWNASGQQNAYGNWGNDGSPVNGVKGSAPIPHGEVGLYFGAFITQTLTPNPVFHPNGRITFPSTPTIVADPLYGPVTLSQTVNLNTSQTYLLDFWASGESARTAGTWQPGLFGLDISGENTVYLAAPSGLGPLGAFQRYKVYFKPNSSLTTIKFTNWGHISNFGFASELCLDDVILNTVPEPGSLIAIGLGSLLLIRRRVSSDGQN